MDWDDVRFFLAVSRQGSYKAAARQLRVDATTVGRRLLALEEALGARLFIRTAEALELTSAGLQLQAHAERVEVELLGAERALQAQDSRVEGTLRVTAPDGFLHHALLPALGALRRQHPALLLELAADARSLDLTRREADIAIRLARPKDSSLVARRLGAFDFGLFAADSYLERRGSPRNLRALVSHDLIGFDSSLDESPHVRWLRRQLKEPRYALRVNTTTSQAVACAEGLGIALLPGYLGAREPRLRRLLPRVAGPRRELWSVTHQDLRGSARVSAFVGFVSELVAGWA